MKLFRFWPRATMKDRVLDGISLIIALLVCHAMNAQVVAGQHLAANSLLTIAMITREALRILENNLKGAKTCNRQWTTPVKLAA